MNPHLPESTTRCTVVESGEHFLDGNVCMNCGACWVAAVTYENRCVRCGDRWVSDDAPPCCMDPIGDELPVTRTYQPQYGLVLATVRNHDGETIAATHERPDGVAA